MTARMPLRTVAAACAVAGLLATAGCTGSPSATPSSSPSPTSPATVAPTDHSAAAEILRGKVSALLVQCLAGHHLIPRSALAGTSGSPPDDSSTWMRDGKVIANQYFSDWWSDPGAGLVVKGRMLVNWVSEIAANHKAWPAHICGPMPDIRS